MKINVTAIGAINLTSSLHRLNCNFVKLSSLKTIFLLTINPVKIAINSPPKGSIIFEVKLSKRSKKV